MPCPPSLPPRILETFRSDYEYEYEFFNVYPVRMPDCVRLSRQLVLSSKSRRYGGPQLSHQHQMLTANYKSLTSNSNHPQQIQIAHIKFKSLTANSNRSQQITNRSQQITNRSQQIQIAHSKFKSFTAN